MYLRTDPRPVYQGKIGRKSTGPFEEDMGTRDKTFSVGILEILGTGVCKSQEWWPSKK